MKSHQDNTRYTNRSVTFLEPIGGGGQTVGAGEDGSRSEGETGHRDEEGGRAEVWERGKGRAPNNHPPPCEQTHICINMNFRIFRKVKGKVKGYLDKRITIRLLFSIAEHNSSISGCPNIMSLSRSISLNPYLPSSRGKDSPR